MAAGNPDEKSASEPKKDRTGSLSLVFSLVNLVATCGMLGVLAVSFMREKKRVSIEDIVVSPHGAEHAEPEKSGEKEGEGGAGGSLKFLDKKKSDFGRMVTLEPFTVNLSTPGSASAKFVRVNISLEIPADDTEVEVSSKIPQVRNTIIDLFNAKRPADLAVAEGREYLKEEIKNAINGFLVTGKVRGVYFTSFAMTS